MRYMHGPLFMAKVIRVGNSVMFAIDRQIRDELRLVPGEVVIMRLSPPYLVVRRAVPEREIPMTDVGASALPPPWPRKEPNATDTDTKKGTPPRASTPDSGTDG